MKVSFGNTVTSGLQLIFLHWNILLKLIPWSFQLILLHWDILFWKTIFCWLISFPLIVTDLCWFIYLLFFIRCWFWFVDSQLISTDLKYSFSDGNLFRLWKVRLTGNQNGNNKKSYVPIDGFSLYHLHRPCRHALNCKDMWWQTGLALSRCSCQMVQFGKFNLDYRSHYWANIRKSANRYSFKISTLISSVLIFKG